MKATVAARVVDRCPQLVEDLVLADDDRIAPDGNRDRVTDRGLADEDTAVRRKPVCRRGLAGRLHDVCLDPVARLKNQVRAVRVLAKPSRETLPFGDGNVTRVGDERDDHVLPGRHLWATSERHVDGAGCRRRLALGRDMGTTPWPVIVATRSRSIARSAASRRSVVSAASKPRRRAATASS